MWYDALVANAVEVRMWYDALVANAVEGCITCDDDFKKAKELLILKIGLVLTFPFTLHRPVPVGWRTNSLTRKEKNIKTNGKNQKTTKQHDESYGSD